MLKMNLRFFEEDDEDSKIVKVYRSFNTVGQGAFYTESFFERDTKHVVYDCGSHKNKSLIEYKIENVFEKGECIEAVFISHFDEDHINGLEFLLNHCTVKKLFLPLLQPTDKALLLLHLLTSGVSSHSFIYSFVESPERSASETRIIYIEEFDDESFTHREASPDDTLVIDADVIKTTIPSGYPCKFKEFDWVYIPFNYKEAERRSDIKKLFSKHKVPMPSSPSDVPDLYWRFSCELAKIYKSLAGGINSNSMVVYSGPTLVSKFRGYCNLNWYCDIKAYSRCYCIYQEVGCLYTGDYDASGADKWKRLFESYKEYMSLIGTWQIPHHGAKSCYNPQIANHALVAVASAGSTNQYGHPHEFVMRDLSLKGVKTFTVTEKRDSQAHFVIHLEKL
jgi:ribonuclease BN (tRNA processing enzyme)